MTISLAFYNTYQEILHLIKVMNEHEDVIKNVKFARVIIPFVNNNLPHYANYVCIFDLECEPFRFNLNNIHLVNYADIRKQRIQGKTKWIPAVINNENKIDIEKTLAKIQGLIIYP